MNYYERIQRSIDFMEENLENDIKVEDAAEEAYMSVSSFYRIFFAITGYQAKEYLIHRRISKSVDELRQGQVKVIDVAMKYAYNSVDAFSRIFKKITGYTPSACAHGIYQYQFERMNVMEQYFEDENQDRMEQYPEIKVISNLPEMRVAYYCYYGKCPEDGAFSVMQKWVLKNKLDYKNGNYRIFGYNAPDSDPSGEEYGYEVCVTIPQDMVVEDDKVKVKVLKGGYYAVLSIEPSDDIGEEIMKGWQRFGKWLEGSRYTYGDAQWLEEHLGFGDNFEHLGGVDLYMPIMERTQLEKFEVEEEVVDPLTVASYTATGRGAELEARNYMFAWANEQGIDFSTGAVRIFAFYDSQKLSQPDFFYKLMIQIPENMEITDKNITKEVFQGGLYLKKNIKYKNNAQSWYQFIQFVDQSGSYRCASRPFMEEYLLTKPAIGRETDVVQHMAVEKTVS